MEEFENTLTKLLNTLKEYQGASPIFSIDYHKKEILIKEASSGFLKRLYEDDRVCAHLTREGIKVTYFK